MEDYQEYFVARRPSHWGMKVIYFWHSRMLNIVSRMIPYFNDKTVLEIGAGHGFIASCCQKKDIDYIGHELNATQAATLNAMGYAVTQARIPPIPPGKAVQVIWLSHVLEHSSGFNEAKEILKACYERLDPEGYVVILAPDVLHWKMHFWSWDWSHGFPTTITRVTQLLNETGFVVIKATHHTATFTQPIVAWTLSLLFKLVPVEALDYLCEKIIGRRLFQAFMSVYGYRQILLIGQKG